MAIRGNRYSDPALGQAFESLAGLFAPMSGQEVAGYSAADLNRQKALLEQQKYEGIASLMSEADPTAFDRRAAALGIINPNQGFGARDMADATQRYGYDQSLAGTRYGADMDYAASTENNVRDNARASQVAAIEGLTAPLGQGEVSRGLGTDVWGALGIPGMPATPEFAGAPKPLTKAEVEGGLLSDLAATDPDFARWAVGGSKDPIAVLGPEGPVMMPPDQAAGAGVYEKPSDANAPKLTNVRLPDGSVAVAAQTDAGLVDVNTRQPLPQGTTMFSTSATGSNEDVGLGQSAQNRVQLELLDNVSSQATGQRLLDLVTANPASQGALGWIRGTAQDAIQTGSEIGAYFGGETQRIADEIASGVADATLMAPGGAFDPTLPAIDMLSNLFVYNYAKSITGERLSNEAIRQWRQSMGLNNMLGNQADTLARLNEAMSSLRQKEQMLRTTVGGSPVPSLGGVAGASPVPTAPGAAPAGPTPVAPAGVPPVGHVEDGHRFMGGDPSNPSNWEQVQ